MNTRRAGKTQLSGLANSLPESVQVGVIGNGADKAQRQNARLARRKKQLLVSVKQTFGERLHPHFGGKILGAEEHAEHARRGGSNLIDIAQPCHAFD